MKEDIIKMAREAGFTNPERFDTDDENLRGILKDFWVNLERFAALFAAAEREACAKVCEEVGNRDRDSHAWDAAAAIRAKGQA